MKLIDEVKKLRDECKKEEEYYNERFNLWMQYKGESWPDLPSDSSACQSVGAIRAKLDRIISDYSEETDTCESNGGCGAKIKGENCNEND